MAAEESMGIEEARVALGRILEGYEMISYQECELYLVDREALGEIMLLSAAVNAGWESGSKKREPFWHVAKLINPLYPAVKFNVSQEHKYAAVFDREKVHGRIKEEADRHANKERELLEELLRNPEHGFESSEAEQKRRELEEKLAGEQQRVEEIIEHFESYDVVITSFEDFNYYPYVYYVPLKGEKLLPGKSEHLRKNAPNILYYQKGYLFEKLRASDKIKRVIETHDRIAHTIYVKERGEDD